LGSKKDVQNSQIQKTGGGVRLEKSAKTTSGEERERVFRVPNDSRIRGNDTQFSAQSPERDGKQALPTGKKGWVTLKENPTGKRIQTKQDNVCTYEENPVKPSPKSSTKGQEVSSQLTMPKIRGVGGKVVSQDKKMKGTVVQEGLTNFGKKKASGAHTNEQSSKGPHQSYLQSWVPTGVLGKKPKKKYRVEGKVPTDPIPLGRSILTEGAKSENCSPGIFWKKKVTRCTKTPHTKVIGPIKNYSRGRLQRKMLHRRHSWEKQVRNAQKEKHLPLTTSGKMG